MQDFRNLDVWRRARKLNKAVDFRRCLDIAMGSACELECEVILSSDLAFITEQVQERIVANRNQPLRISRRVARRHS